MADVGQAANGWSVSIGKLLVQVLFKRMRGGVTHEEVAIIDLASPDSIGRFLDALDSPRMASVVEASLRDAFGDGALLWHRSLASWQRRPRGVIAPAAPTDAGPA
jgi:hypothetical protein